MNCCAGSACGHASTWIDRKGSQDDDNSTLCASCQKPMHNDGLCGRFLLPDTLVCLPCFRQPHNINVQATATKSSQSRRKILRAKRPLLKNVAQVLSPVMPSTKSTNTPIRFIPESRKRRKREDDSISTAYEETDRIARQLGATTTDTAFSSPLPPTKRRRRSSFSSININNNPRRLLAHVNQWMSRAAQHISDQVQSRLLPNLERQHEGQSTRERLNNSESTNNNPQTNEPTIAISSSPATATENKGARSPNNHSPAPSVNRKRRRLDHTEVSSISVGNLAAAPSKEGRVAVNTNSSNKSPSCPATASSTSTPLQQVLSAPRYVNKKRRTSSSSGMLAMLLSPQQAFQSPQASSSKHQKKRRRMSSSSSSARSKNTTEALPERSSAQESFAPHAKKDPPAESEWV